MDATKYDLTKNLGQAPPTLISALKPQAYSLEFIRLDDPLKQITRTSGGEN